MLLEMPVRVPAARTPCSTAESSATAAASGPLRGNGAVVDHRLSRRHLINEFRRGRLRLPDRRRSGRRLASIP